LFFFFWMIHSGIEKEEKATVRWTVGPTRVD